jgi:hypothetical protein
MMWKGEIKIMKKDRVINGKRCERKISSIMNRYLKTTYNKTKTFF